VIRILCGPLHFAKPSSQPNSADIRNSVGDPTQHVQNCPQSFPLLSLKSFSKPIYVNMVFNMFNKEISISLPCGSPWIPVAAPWHPSMPCQWPWSQVRKPPESLDHWRWIFHHVLF
jgi:hypothetical protein